MRYQVVVTVDVIARTAEEAEREALKAIVSDITGRSKRIILVRTEVSPESAAGGMLTLDQVAERTSLRAERILEIAGGPLFPASVDGKWREGDIERWIRDLPSGHDLALDDD